MNEIKSEARLSMTEAIGIITGHGVGSGILAVPFLASRNSWQSFVLIIVLAYAINLLLHTMIAELSLNNGGAQFIKCFENELFKGKLKMIATWTAFALLGLSVIANVSSFITGSAAVFSSWFGLDERVGMLLYFVLAAAVVFFGMKLVGICEKYSVIAMVAVVAILLVATLRAGTEPLPSKFIATSNVLALYSMISFALSAVMSVPQVVKGLNGDRKQITKAIAAGTGVNVSIIILITLMTLAGAGSSITENGALVDLSSRLGGWVSVVGYVFSLLALSTSFWANTLNMRDIISEQTGWNLRLCWLAASLPCLLIAVFRLQSFVGLARIAGVIQVLTGLGIILAYNRSRKRTGESLICGFWGTLPFQLLVIAGSLAATVGSVISVK
jgi:amino acid permease